MALVDMAYNLGVNGLVTGFPNLMKAIRDNDKPNWLEAAKHCRRKLPISNDRNQKTKALFEMAAKVVQEPQTTPAFPGQNLLFFGGSKRNTNQSSKDTQFAMSEALNCGDALSFNL